MNSSTSPVDIRPDHLAIVQDILRAHLPARFKVWVFGSRANWTTKDLSDLDLAVQGTDQLAHETMLDLEIAFEESNLPYTVDVVDLNLVDARFKQIIELQRVPLLMAAEQSTVGEWRKCELTDLTDNFDSIRVPVKQGNRRRGTYPYYGASGIIDYVDDFLFDGEYLLIAEDGENLRTRTTPIAFVATGKFWVNNHAHIVRGNSNADTHFLKYTLSQLDVSGYLSGSTMPKLTQENMNRISVLTPPLPEQRAIAHILGTLDDKIQLNRRMNQTLEAMARAIFQDWFVDFGPVRAKLENREDPYLPQELWDLVPRRAWWNRSWGRYRRGGRSRPWVVLATVVTGKTPKYPGILAILRIAMFSHFLKIPPDDARKNLCRNRNRDDAHRVLEHPLRQVQTLPAGSISVSCNREIQD